MNLWRWFGVFIFVAGLICFTSASKLPVYAGEKKDQKVDDTKKEEPKKDDTKKEEAKKEEPKKDDPKKDEPKKDDTKKEETKKEEAKSASGDTFVWKAFDPKSKGFFQKIETTTKQTIKVSEQQVPQEQKQTFIIQWTPKEMKDGNYVVAQKIVGVDMSINIGGNNISFNSRSTTKPKNPMTDFFDKLINQELTYVIDSKTWEVKEIQGRKEFVSALTNAHPQMRQLLENIMSEDALKKMAEPTWFALPSGPVEKDATWKKESTLDLGPIGTYKTTFDFTYAGKDKINIATKLDYTAPGSNKQGGLPFTIEKANLTSKGGSGEAVFDREKGRFASSKTSMKLAGDLTINVGNMSTVVNLDQDQESVVTSMDENPWRDAASEKK